MSINLQIEVDDEATPVLAGLVESLSDFTEFHEFLALDLAEYARVHIRGAAATRHKTADRLGSAQTGYLAKAAETVEADSDAVGFVEAVVGPVV